MNSSEVMVIAGRIQPASENNLSSFGSLHVLEHVSLIEIENFKFSVIQRGECTVRQGKLKNFTNTSKL